MRGCGMATKAAFTPAASWTYRVDSEEKKKHDFSNLVLEFRYAVERQDRMMTEYCNSELERMYREKGQRTGARQSTHCKDAL
jgi:hypothetical protein